MNFRQINKTKQVNYFTFKCVMKFDVVPIAPEYVRWQVIHFAIIEVSFLETKVKYFRENKIDLLQISFESTNNFWLFDWTLFDTFVFVFSRGVAMVESGIRIFDDTQDGFWPVQSNDTFSLLLLLLKVVELIVVSVHDFKRIDFGCGSSSTSTFQSSNPYRYGVSWREKKWMNFTESINFEEKNLTNLFIQISLFPF